MQECYNDSAVLSTGIRPFLPCIPSAGRVGTTDISQKSIEIEQNLS